MDSNEKVFGILAYLGWLVLVPILAGKTEFSKFHANQGLVLAIAEIAVGIVVGVAVGVLMVLLPPIGIILGSLSGLLGLAELILAIMGIVSAAQGEMKPLPIIGNIKILK
ncbi:MAG: hypothetical protein K2N06_08770 [Oscillospiraceae bacterium]|nr:hypothetical protein [Oscillospiraceae bacterium]